MSQRGRFSVVVYRFLAALAAGLAVAGIAYVCAYFDQRGQYGFQSKGLSTQEKLDALQHEIERHRQTTGNLPAELGELGAVRFYHRFSTDAEGREAASKEMQAIVIEEAPYVLLAQPNWVIYFGNDIDGYIYYNDELPRYASLTRTSS